MIWRGLVATDHPILAHVIPIRRCNLSCAYCNEYDDFSPPVPAAVMLRRIDRLAELGTSIVTISGGEPLLHLELEAIVRHIRQRGMMASLLTNGYLLTTGRIRTLNHAGLDHLQISIDNVQPDEVSKKSLKVLDKKLQLLAEHAEFPVHINSVLGAGVRNPQDALAVAARAAELGFTSSVGLIHDGHGALRPLGVEENEIYRELKRGTSWYLRLINRFQDNLAAGRPQRWRCRAGARYLYICEDGLVHYCSQQRGYPAKPLEDYTVEDIQREFLTEKSCAPWCTVSCVQRFSLFDCWRAPQTRRARPGPEASGLVQIAGSA